MRIIALIPARGGSKTIPNKNIKDFQGHPLIAHSIFLANNCKFINETIVTTDSEEISEIAIKYGAKVPFLRPSKIAQDESMDIDFFKHYLKWCKEENKQLPDLIVQLRPTYPIRNPDLLDHCLNKFIQNYDNYDSLRTVVKNNFKSPYKMYTLDRDAYQ